jgi:Meiotically Up-regulated Gene 113 (MUG113) protein
VKRKETMDEATVWVYFIYNGETQRIKIGQSVNVGVRLATLAGACGCELEVLGIVDSNEWEEAALHRQFAAHRVRHEWFSDHPEIREFITANARPFEVRRPGPPLVMEEERAAMEGGSAPASERQRRRAEEAREFVAAVGAGEPERTAPADHRQEGAFPGKKRRSPVTYTFECHYGGD